VFGDCQVGKLLVHAVFQMNESFQLNRKEFYMSRAWTGTGTETGVWTSSQLIPLLRRRSTDNHTFPWQKHDLNNFHPGQMSNVSAGSRRRNNGQWAAATALW